MVEIIKYALQVLGLGLVIYINLILWTIIL